MRNLASIFDPVAYDSPSYQNRANLKHPLETNQIRVVRSIFIREPTVYRGLIESYLKKGGGNLLNKQLCSHALPKFAEIWYRLVPDD